MLGAGHGQLGPMPGQRSPEDVAKRSAVKLALLHVRLRLLGHRLGGDRLQEVQAARNAAIAELGFRVVRLSGRRGMLAPEEGTEARGSETGVGGANDQRRHTTGSKRSGS